MRFAVSPPMARSRPSPGSPKERPRPHRSHSRPPPSASCPDGSPLIGGGSNVARLGGDPVLQTIAGTGRSGFDVDAGPATAVTLGQVSAIATTADGSVLIADADDDRVRRLTTDGKLLTVAGNNTPLPRVALYQSGGAAAAAPLGAAAPNSGNCGRKKPRSRSLSVSFFTSFAPPPLRARRGHVVTVPIRLTEKANVAVAISGPKTFKRTVKRSAPAKVIKKFKLIKLKPGSYTLRVQASARAGTRRVYSCATASLCVT